MLSDRKRIFLTGRSPGAHPQAQQLLPGLSHSPLVWLSPGARGWDGPWPTRSQTEREATSCGHTADKAFCTPGPLSSVCGETETAAKDKGPGLEAPEPPTPACGLLGGRRVRKPPSAHPHPTSSPTSPPIPLCPVGRSTHLWGFKKSI